MELRKLQLVGRASFSVTLPPSWIKENNLKPSDQITITREEDGSLRLVSGIIPEKEEVKITIDADRCKEPGLLWRLIVGGYIRACDSIEVVSKHTISQNRRREINYAANSLMGVGIIESTSKRVTLQSMVDHSKLPIRPLLKRLCGISSSMYKDAMRALSDKDSSLVTDIIQRKNEANKIYWLTLREIAAALFDRRVLGKIGLKRTPDLALHIAIIPRMKSLADYATDIANNQQALGKKWINDADLRNVILLGKMAHEIIYNACEAFFKGDVALANRMAESLNHFDETKEELIKKVVPRIKDVQVGIHLMNITRDMHMVAIHGKLIAELTIANFVTEKSNLP